MKRSIDFLLKNANHSIRLRLKKEILGCITAEEEAELIAQIKEESIYKLIASCQKENGWLGNGFHGPNKDAGALRQRGAAEAPREAGADEKGDALGVLEGIHRLRLRGCTR